MKLFLQKSSTFFLSAILLVFFMGVSGSVRATPLYALTDDFVITIKTDNTGTSSDTQFTIPTTGSGYNYNVDCDGDGTDEATGQSGNYTCDYGTGNEGTYTVRIKDNSGTGTGFPRIYFNNEGDKDKLLTIEQWGTGIWASMESAFYGCSNLAGQASDVPDLSSVSDMSYMFSQAIAFNQNIGIWNTGNVTNMSYMFNNAQTFDQEIGDWDTELVTNMEAMFYQATAFDQDLGDWETGSVANMVLMFSSASSFDQDLGEWDVSTLANATDMFFGVTLSVSNYDALLNGWNAQTLQSGVTLDAGGSKYCLGEAARTNLTSPSGHNWTIIDGGKDCSDYIDDFVITIKTDNTGTSSDTQFTIPTTGSGYNYNVDCDGDGTDEVTGQSGNYTCDYGTGNEGTYTVRIKDNSGTGTGFPRIYFNNGGDKDKLLTIEQWGTGIWASMESAFYGCSNLAGQASDVPDLSSVSDMSYMFSQAIAFNQNIGIWNTGNVTNMSYMFNNAQTFDQEIGDWDTELVTNMEAMFYQAIAFDQYIGDWETSAVKEMSYMFSGASNFNQNLGAWETSDVIDMSYMFSGANKFNQDTEDWDTSAVTDMSYMFSGASIFDQNISGWETSAVTDMHAMFADAAAFDHDIGGWDTSAVTDMGYMFSEASDFDQDLEDWDTSAVQDMSYMFSEASVFNHALEDWDTSAVTDMSNMFAGASDFNQYIGNWDTSAVTNMAGMFNDASSFNQDVGAWDTGNVMYMNTMFDGSTSFNQDVGGWDVVSLTDATDMFAGVTLSVSNYDSLLNGWNELALQNGVSFHGGSSNYCKAEAARNNLTNPTEHNWTIIDGGKLCPSFEANATRWTEAFDYNHGWRVSDHPRMFADVDGDGDDDAVGFGLDGIYVALSDGSSFAANATKWTSALDYSHGWRVSDHPRMFADVNGDGMADAVGFGLDGIYVALSDGSSFAANATKWTSAFDYNHGWRVSDHPRMFADVDGDGDDDAVGFGLDGIYVALSDGSSFAANATKWTSALDYNHGWRVSDHPRMFADVDGDGMDDAVGFGLNGIYVALSTGGGFAADATLWTTAFDYNHGWRVSDHPRLFADMNGDGKDDAIGFGLDGVYVALSDGQHLAKSAIRGTTAFDYQHGWRVLDHPRMLADVNGDGMADAVGFGLDGIYIALAQ